MSGKILLSNRDNTHLQRAVCQPIFPRRSFSFHNLTCHQLSMAMTVTDELLPSPEKEAFGRGHYWCGESRAHMHSRLLRQRLVTHTSMNQLQQWLWEISSRLCYLLLTWYLVANEAAAASKWTARFKMPLDLFIDAVIKLQINLIKYVEKPTEQRADSGVSI